MKGVVEDVGCSQRSMSGDYLGEKKIEAISNKKQKQTKNTQV